MTVQSSVHTLGRSPKYFHKPMQFRPERYLPPSHPLYDKAFAHDCIKGLPAFSLGPRACIGRELGWAEARLFMAKVLWHFDVVRAPGETLDMERTRERLASFRVSDQATVHGSILATTAEDIAEGKIRAGTGLDNNKAWLVQHENASSYEHRFKQDFSLNSGRLISILSFCVCNSPTPTLSCQPTQFTAT